MKIKTPNTNISEQSISTFFLKDANVTTAKIADEAVTIAKIDKTGASDNQALIYDSTTDTIGWADVSSYTDANAVSAIEAETSLNLQEGLTVDTDIKIGDGLLRNTFPVTGIKITSPGTKAAWASMILEEYGGDYADADELPYNIHNPTFVGEISGGTPASPTAVSAYNRAAALAGVARFGTGTTDLDTVAYIDLQTNENQGSNNRGGKIGFNVNPTGGGTDTKEILLLHADQNNANFVFDPNGDFSNTTISTQSTNGFFWDNLNTFENNVQMEADLDVDGNVNVDGNITLPTGGITVTTGTILGALVQGYTVGANVVNAGNLTISDDTITTSGSEVEFDSDFNVTGTTYFGAGSGTSISADGDINTFGSATSVHFGAPVRLDRIDSDPTGEIAMMYFNTTNSKFRGFNGNAWVDLDSQGSSLQEETFSGKINLVEDSASSTDLSKIFLEYTGASTGNAKAEIKLYSKDTTTTESAVRYYHNGVVATNDILVIGQDETGSSNNFAIMNTNGTAQFVKSSLTTNGGVGGGVKLTVGDETMTNGVPVQWASIPSLTNTAYQIDGMVGMHPTSGLPIYYNSGWKYFVNNLTAS